MYLQVLKETEKFGLCFSMLNERKKGTTNTFSSYKLSSKLYLVFLEIKL